MISYTTLGTNQWSQALEFYDALLAPMGASRLMELEGFVLYGKTLATGNLAVVHPFDRKEATVGNGTMVAMQVESKDAVAEIHAKALEQGVC